MMPKIKRLNSKIGQIENWQILDIINAKNDS